MKRTVFFLSICLVVSCNLSEKKQTRQAEKQRQDSLWQVKQARINDSITAVVQQKEAERLELSRTAFGDAMFGMSREEVLKTNTFKGGYDEFHIVSANDGQIGNRSYEITAGFHNDTLYKIYITSYSYVTANYIDTDLQELATNLRDVIAQKYGNPTVSFGGPDFFQFQPGYIVWMYKWIIDDKEIKIGMSEKETGSEYKVVCWITYKPTEEKIEQAEKEKVEEQINKDASRF